MRLDVRGGTVLVEGTVPSARCRDDVCGLVRGELADVPVHCDILVADASAPDHAEEVS